MTELTQEANPQVFKTYEQRTFILYVLEFLWWMSLDLYDNNEATINGGFAFSALLTFWCGFMIINVRRAVPYWVHALFAVVIYVFASFGLEPKAGTIWFDKQTGAPVTSAIFRFIPIGLQSPKEVYEVRKIPTVSVMWQQKQSVAHTHPKITCVSNCDVQAIVEDQFEFLIQPTNLSEYERIVKIASLQHRFEEAPNISLEEWTAGKLGVPGSAIKMISTPFK